MPYLYIAIESAILSDIVLVCFAIGCLEVAFA